MGKRPFHLAAVVGLLTMLALSGCGGNEHTVTIGVKFDQPGMSLRNPDGSLSGFDVDVATYVAGQLGYKPDEIEWKEAPSGQRETLIQNGQVDFIVGSYSINDQRKQKIAFAGPYFQTGQDLLVRADETGIVGPESLENGKKLCSVAGSTPAQNIQKKYPGVQLQQYDTYSLCVEALKNEAVDALTTDAVILAGYAQQNPGVLKVVGKPFTTELYGIGVSRENDELRAKINDALQKFIDTGEWQASFDRYLGKSGYTPPPPPKIDRYEVRPAVAEPAGKILDQYRGEILKAFWTTIKLAVYSAIGALIIGTLLAAMRLSPVPMLRWLGATYVTILRNTPLTLILLFCAFGLGQTLGITLARGGSRTEIVDSGFRLAVLGLTIYTAAFVCESLRSGVNTVHVGQAEAARSLGLTFSQNLRLILLPQAFRSVIAPLGSVLIALTKNTTIASAIGVAEAAYQMKAMIENTAALLLVGSIFAAGFVVLTLPLGLLFTYLGRRLAVNR
jgi:His/Glu/Gln/Arg/opine family amino acid ABC transporter permease subunit